MVYIFLLSRFAFLRILDLYRTHLDSCIAAIGNSILHLLELLSLFSSELVSCEVKQSELYYSFENRVNELHIERGVD